MYGGVHRCADVHGDVQMGAWRCTEGCAGVRRCAKVCGVHIGCMEVCRGVHGWVHGDVWRCAEGVQRCMEVCRGVHRSA